MCAFIYARVQYMETKSSICREMYKTRTAKPKSKINLVRYSQNNKE